jgi:HEAT repeat protein
MVHVVAGIAALMIAIGVLLVVVLLARRVVLGVRERRSAEAERRVRPLALALIAGESPGRKELSPAEQAALADLLGRYSRKVIGEADTRIAEYFHGSTALRGALRDMHSRRPWRRAAAAYRLGDIGGEEVGPPLLSALGDRKREVRAAAARSLGRVGVKEAAVPLVEALVSRQVPYGVAGQAFVELGPDVVPELHGALRRADPQVRAAALTLLGLVGDARDSVAAARALEDPSAEVRAAAAVALGRIGTSTAEGELRSALADRVPYVRAAAAVSLGLLGAKGTVPQLLEVARTDRFQPARAAAQAVARIDSVSLAAAAALPDAGPHLREASDVLAL